MMTYYILLILALAIILISGAVILHARTRTATTALYLFTVIVISLAPMFPYVYSKLGFNVMSGFFANFAKVSTTLAFIQAICFFLYARSLPKK